MGDFNNNNNHKHDSISVPPMGEPDPIEKDGQINSKAPVPSECDSSGNHLAAVEDGLNRDAEDYVGSQPPNCQASDAAHDEHETNEASLRKFMEITNYMGDRAKIEELLRSCSWRIEYALAVYFADCESQVLTSSVPGPSTDADPSFCAPRVTNSDQDKTMTEKDLGHEDPGTAHSTEASSGSGAVQFNSMELVAQQNVRRASPFCSGMFSQGFGASIWSLASGIVSIMKSLLVSFLPSRSLLFPGSAVSQLDLQSLVGTASEDFNAFFESTYGTLKPRFESQSLMETLTRAEASSKPLVIYIHHSRSRHCHVLARNVLAADVIVDLVKSIGAFVWGTHSQSVEAAFLTRHFLRCSGLPHLAVVAPSSRITSDQNTTGRLISSPTRGTSVDDSELSMRFRIVASFEGSDGDMLVSRVIAALLEARELADQKAQALTERERRLLADRKIREEQDLAYKAALAKDQEMERNSLAKRKQLEQEQQRQSLVEANHSTQLVHEQQFLEQRRIRCKSFVEAEASRISAGEPPEAQPVEAHLIQVRIKLPNNVRVDRKFSVDTPLDNLFHWIELTSMATSRGSAEPHEVAQYLGISDFGEFEQSVIRSSLECVTPKGSPVPIPRAPFFLGTSFPVKKVFPPMPASEPGACHASAPKVTFADVGLMEDTILFIHEMPLPPPSAATPPFSSDIQ